MHGCFIFQRPADRKKKMSVRAKKKKKRTSYLIPAKINVYRPDHNPSHGLFSDFPLYCKASKLNLENNDFYRPCKCYYNLTGQEHQTGSKTPQMCEIFSYSVTPTFNLKHKDSTKMSKSFWTW